MKKTLIAAALLSLSAGAAYADSVTLYGVVDMGLINDKADGSQARSALDSGVNTPSRWGMRGVEQLSDDLSAVFVLENAFSADTGVTGNNNRLFGRDAYVGLQSRTWGSLRLGRTTNIMQRLGAGIVSPFGLSYSLNQAASTFAYNKAEFGSSGRVDNAVYVETPDLMGVVLMAGYSFNTGTALPGAAITTEQPGFGNNNRMLDVAARYDNGPLAAIVNYTRTNVAGSATVQQDPESIVAGASYDFKVVKLHLGYDRILHAQNQAAGSPITDTGWLTGTRNADNAYSVGISAPIGAGSLMASYQRLTSAKLDVYGVGYSYNLSKRTSVYAFFDISKARDFDTGDDIDRHQIAGGIVHKF